MKLTGCMVGVLATAVLVFGVSTASAELDAGLQAYHGGDYDTAYKELLPEAEDGNALAQTALGIMYQNGRGVKRDFVKAKEWYSKAAEQEDKIAQNNLGFMYWKGQGVPRDAARAAELFSKATLQGYGLAAYHLADLHRLGQGVPRDLLRAFVLYTFSMDTLKSRQKGKADMQRKAIANSLSEEELKKADNYLAALRKARGDEPSEPASGG